MNFEEFIEQVLDTMKEYFCDCEVKSNQVRKNNGVVLTAINVLHKDSNMTPSLYLESFYEMYTQGKSMRDITDEMIDMIEAYAIHKEVDVSFFTDRAVMEDKIGFKLIHLEKNSELLKDVPFFSYLDLAIVFILYVEDPSYGKATILIHENHMKSLGMTKEELMETAIKNMPHMLEYEICNMKELIRSMPFVSEQVIYEIEHDMAPVIYACTNKSKFLGASAILYPNLIKDFAAACGKNLMIIPSSIHEVLLVPVEDASDKQEYNRMVEEVNATQVERQEILSDHVYYYDRELDEIIIP